MITVSPKSFKKKLKKSIRHALTPPPKLSLSEWCDKYRILSPEACATPGRWRTSNTEYLREIMDTVTNPAYEYVVIMSSAQIGKSELLINTLLYFCTQDPRSILFVQPTVAAAQGFSKERLAGALRDCSLTKHMFSDAKLRDGNNSVLNKQFPGGFLALTGANSPTSLASRPISLLLLDESSRFPLDLKQEGNPIKLAEQRTATFWNRKIVVVSTPTTTGSCHISELYEQGDQRKYNLRCRHCNDTFYPEWNLVSWLHDEEENVDDYNTALLTCPHCGVGLNDSERQWGILHGEWIASYPGRKKASFHLNAVCSPWTRLSELVREYLEAKNDNSLLRVFYNTKLGIPWEETGEVVDISVLGARTEEYNSKTLPSDVLMITAGADVQGDRIECTTFGWGENKHVWMVEHQIFNGDTSGPQVWNDFYNYLTTEFKREDRLPLKISATAIDSGFNTQMVYSFCRSHPKMRLYPTKGRGGPGIPIIPKKGTRLQGVTLFNIGVDSAKTEIMSMLKNSNPSEPNYFHFPESADDDYFTQLTSETLVKKYKNSRTYLTWELRKNVRNECLDTAVYGRAMFYLLNPNFKAIKRQQATKLESLKEEVVETEIVEINETVDNSYQQHTTKKTTKTLIRKRNSWLGSLGV